MTNNVVLPPRTFQDGFWGAARRNGYDVQETWEATSLAVGAVFGLTPGESRDFLDGPAGRLLAQDLSFIVGGRTDVEAIETLLFARLQDDGWRRWYDHAVAAVRGSR